MSTSDKNHQTSPLKGDPKRQAVDPFRGHDYQIWHSIYAWLQLRDEEVLYLEGAEDFDVVGPEAATAVQVKDTAKNITLRSPNVIDAIIHYWQLRKDNPDKTTILFRFLTRSRIGIEQGQPFGKGVKGLELWQHCVRNQEEIEKLRTFLLSIERLPNDLQNFLSKINDQVLFKQLIEPIKWETGSREARYVEQAIEEKLINYGEKYSIPPPDAVSVVNRLFKEVSTITCQKEHRFLTRALFAQIFADETRVSIPKRQYQELTQTFQAFNQSILSNFFGGQLGFAFQAIPLIQTTIPPIPANFVYRNQLVTELSTYLENTGILILTGSTGIGKTTLAKMIARLDNENWYWIELSNLTTEQISFILHQIASLVHQKQETINVVFDALDLSATNSQRYEDYLGSLLYAVSEAHGKVIITSQKALPQRLSRNLGVHPMSLQTIPPFEIDEITNFALQLGCPKGNLAVNWAKIVFLQTKGHPQLIHVRLTYLAGIQWPAPKEKDLLRTPSDILQEQTEIREQLIQQLSTEQKELLYRLSLISGKFRRDHAISVGDLPIDETHPALTYAGDVFDQLISRWVDALDMGYYRVSPLLENAAQEVWPEQRIQTLHAALGQVFLNSSPLTTIEGANAFFHAWWGRSVDTLVPLLQSFLTASPEVWEYVTRDLSWFMYFGVETRKPLFPEEMWLNSLLRLFQFELAVKMDPEKAPFIVDVWDTETVPHEPQRSFLVERFMLASKVLIRTQVTIPPKRLLGFLVEIADIHDQSEDVRGMCRSFESSIADTRDDIIAILFSFIVYRCKERQFVDLLIDGLEQTPSAVRKQMLTVFNASDAYARMVTDSVWMHEADCEMPDWLECLRVLSKTKEYALLWEAPSLAIEAAHAMAIVYDEYLHDAPKALAVLNQITAQIEFSSNVLEYARATIFFNQKAYKEALSIVKPLLPGWFPADEYGDSMSIFACRIAGVSAAHSGDWSQAAHFFMEGYQRARVFGWWKVYITGFLADAGFALWKAGEYSASVDAFKEVLTGIEESLETSTNLGALRVRKAVERVLLWMQGSLAETSAMIPSPEIAEPWPGICSSPERTEKIREEPLSPVALSWTYLAAVEFSLGFDSSIFQDAYCRFVREQPIAKILPLIHSQNLLAQLDIKYAFRTGQFDTLPAQLALYQSLFQANRKAFMKEKELFKNTEMNMQLETYAVFPSTFIVDHFLVALVALIAKNTFTPEYLQIWRNGLAGHSFQDSVTVWLELVETTFSHTIPDTIIAMKNAREIDEKQLLAALNLCLAEHLHPGDLFYAHAILIGTLLKKRLYLHEIADDLAEMLSRQWLKKCQFRSALNMPNLTVPAIEAACRAEIPGLQKVAQILLAVSGAVSVTLP